MNTKGKYVHAPLKGGKGFLEDKLNRVVCTEQEQTNDDWAKVGFNDLAWGVMDPALSRFDSKFNDRTFYCRGYRE